MCSRESPLGFEIYLVKIQIVLKFFVDLERKAIQTFTVTFISKSLIHHQQSNLCSGHGFIGRYPLDTFPKTHSPSNDEDSGIPSFQNLQGNQFDQLNNRRIDCDRAFAWANIAVAESVMIWLRVNLVISSAISASRITDSELNTFSCAIRR